MIPALSVLKPKPFAFQASGFFVLALALLTAPGCAVFRDVTKPEVAVTSLTFDGGSGFTQVLQVGLKVRNPNAFALDIQRLNYRLFLEDAEVASGRRAEALRIEANDSSHFTVPVELNLFSGWSLVEKLLKSPKNTVDYRLEVDAELGNFGLGTVEIRKQSTIEFAP